MSQRGRTTSAGADFRKYSSRKMDILGFGYAFIVASGGVIGFVKAGSHVSLGMGLLFGGLSAFGAYQLSQDPKNYTVLLVTSGVLMGVMGQRFLHSGKFMPAGLVASLSLLMVARLGIRAISQ